MPDKIKVLLILHDLSLTGAPRVAVEAFRLLRDRVDLRIIALRRGPLQSRVGQLAKLLLVEKTVVNGPVDIVRGFYRRYRRWRWTMGLQRWQPDVIYANSVASLPLFQIMDLPKAPVLLHVHEMHTLLKQYMYPDPELPRCLPARYIAVSEATRDALRDVYGVTDERVALINAFFNEDELVHATQADYPKPASDMGKFVIGGAGRIQWRKGFELWLQTAAALKQRVGTERLRFVWLGGEGDSAEREFLLTAQKLGVSDIVEVVPMNPAPYETFCRFDTFLATAWEDPCPLVVMESMAVGKPVVCVAESGGAREEVGDTGVIVSGFSADRLAEALEDLMNDPERCKALGKAARERAFSHFTPTAQTPKILAEIERLAAQPRPPEG